jgi:hypothetical protein
MISDWKALFDSVKEKNYSKTLHAFLQDEYQNYTIYPPRDMVYQAFKLTKPSELKVVIIGQDPYHNPGQAMGLSFSVPRGIDPPPSLINVYKEIQSDLNIKMNFDNGDLTPWAEQGILLLNAYLTVRAASRFRMPGPNMTPSSMTSWCILIPWISRSFSCFGADSPNNICRLFTIRSILLLPLPILRRWRPITAAGLAIISSVSATPILEKNNVAPIDWQIK